MKAKAWKHFCTITRHRHQVIRNCYHAGILWQGLRHDLSKYSPTEFIPGAKYYQGDRSPNAEEREVNGYSVAWMHHQGRNKHHFEYWQDYHPQTRMKQPVKMPLRYVKEMFCDRVAASKIYYGKDYTEDMPLAYYEKGKYCGYTASGKQFESNFQFGSFNCGLAPFYDNAKLHP